MVNNVAVNIEVHISLQIIVWGEILHDRLIFCTVSHDWKLQEEDFFPHETFTRMFIIMYIIFLQRRLLRCQYRRKDERKLTQVCI